MSIQDSAERERISILDSDDRRRISPLDSAHRMTKNILVSTGRGRMIILNSADGEKINTVKTVCSRSRGLLSKFQTSEKLGTQRSVYHRRRQCEHSK
jgi:hypothetical protein